MALFELTGQGGLDRVVPTSFAAEHVLERADLQLALRRHIGVIDDDILIVAEEFGDFADVNRRIDLLGVDREGQLVVIELKRTEDGGHMELQALRYAAMVSTMTFDQLAETYERHLRQEDPTSSAQAREKLANFLEEAGGEDTVLQRRVRIVLASAGFDTQITTTVLWLNDLYGLDIRCIRLTPYRVENKLLLDVQHVIPLPEAEEMMVRLRRRESAVRAAEQATGGADWTQYIIRRPTGHTAPLRKRRAILALVHALHDAGVSASTLATAIPGSRFLSVETQLVNGNLQEAFGDAYPAARGNLGRWFLESPISDGEETWVLSKQWGLNTLPTLDALLNLAPAPGFGYEAAIRQIE